MPIYEYSCQACGHALEALQKHSDAPLTECPECGRPDLRKLVSAAGFVLKGSGWYVTDFRDKGKQASGGQGADKKAGGGETKAQGAPDAGD